MRNRTKVFAKENAKHIKEHKIDAKMEKRPMCVRDTRVSVCVCVFFTASLMNNFDAINVFCERHVHGIQSETRVILLYAITMRLISVLIFAVMDCNG